MNLRTVIIRTRHELMYHTRPEILKGLKELPMGTFNIPLIYQYSHEYGKLTEVTDKNKIGQFTNIRYDSKGNLVGDLEVYALMNLAKHYTGTVDNIVAGYDPAKLDTPKILAFIVYDIEFKTKKQEEKLNRQKKEQAAKHSMNQNMAKVGEVPIITNNDELNMDEISKKLADEFKKQFASEQSDKQK